MQRRVYGKDRGSAGERGGESLFAEGAETAPGGGDEGRGDCHGRKNNIRRKGICTVGKFETTVVPEFDRIRKKLEEGATAGELAAMLNISVSTLNRYRRQHPEFRRLFEEAGAAADDLVEAALLRRATGYENGDGKEIPPDVRAAVFWLKNRRPESWKDRRELKVSDPVTVTFEPEEKDL